MIRKSFKVFVGAALAFLAVVITAFCIPGLSAVMHGYNQYDYLQKFCIVLACIGTIWLVLYRITYNRQPDVVSFSTMDKSTGRMADHV